MQVAVALGATVAEVDAGLPQTSVPLAPALAVTVRAVSFTPVTTNDTVRAAEGELASFLI